MWYPATVLTPADAEPLTSDDAKAQIRVGYSDDDAYLASLISAARDHVEKYCNVRLATQTVTIKCDVFADMSRLPEAPLQSVSSIIYLDALGAGQTLSADVYEVRADGMEAAIILKYGQVWPAIQSGSRITVIADVGYAVAPPAIKHAMLLYIANAYEQREDAKTDTWTAFDSLLSNFRRGD